MYFGGSEVTFSLVPKGNNHYLVHFKEGGLLERIWIQPPFSVFHQAKLRDQSWLAMIVNQTYQGVMVSPPWLLMEEKPPVQFNYPRLLDEEIMQIDLRKFTNEGYLFIWTPLSKLEIALQWLHKHHYKPLQLLIWKRNQQISHWQYVPSLQMRGTKEFCLIAKALHIPEIRTIRSVGELPTQLMKSEKARLFELIESQGKKGQHLNLFGTITQARQFWTTISLTVPFQT